MSEPISLKFQVNEINIILKALHRRPYHKVFQVIHSIHSQAHEQAKSKTHPADNNSGLPAMSIEENGIHASQS